MLCDGKTQSAQSAGDEVNASVLRRGLRARPRELTVRVSPQSACRLARQPPSFPGRRSSQQSARLRIPMHLRLRNRDRRPSTQIRAALCGGRAPGQRELRGQGCARARRQPAASSWRRERCRFPQGPGQPAPAQDKGDYRNCGRESLLAAVRRCPPRLTTGERSSAAVHRLSEDRRRERRSRRGRLGAACNGRSSSRL